MYIHGTNDRLVPITGGEMTAGGTAGGFILSHTQTIDKWVALNKCNSNPVITDLPDIANDGTTIKQSVYGNGTNGAEVASYIIDNGGHTWPQGLQYLSEAIIGKTSQDMNGCEVIWSFFKKFKR
jgi:polyhydroxybutyrate depolymerase